MNKTDLISFFLDKSKTVCKPGRYIGREWNSVDKDWGKAFLRVAILYPDVYEIGMSNQGLRLLYEIINSHQDFLCQRCFAPWFDMEKALRDSNTPLYSLEGKMPLSEFDVVAFSLQHELNYTNILNILDMSGIEIFSAQRAKGQPLVIGGGPCSLNPEPVADFFDFFVIGEAEDIIIPILEKINFCKQNKTGKQELLNELAEWESIYVPSLCSLKESESGYIVPDIKRKIKRNFVRDLNSVPHASKPPVSYIQTVHDRVNLEIMRGCPNACRFCQARVYYGPARLRTAENLISIAEQNYKNTGYEEICLSSLSSGAYPGITDLVKGLFSHFKDENIFLSLPSLWVGKEIESVLSNFLNSKRPALTFAPEVTSCEMKKVIGKFIDEDKLKDIVSYALDRGWKKVKLYYMLGLPGLAISDLEQTKKFIHELLRLNTKRPVSVKLSFSAFIPKPHTPLQWFNFVGRDEFQNQVDFIRKGFKNRRISLDFRDYDFSLLEAVLARGDRRLSGVIYRAWKYGAKFDSWEKEFKYDLWYNAFKDSKINMEHYINSDLNFESELPWQHIDSGVDIFELWNSSQDARIRTGSI